MSGGEAFAKIVSTSRDCFLTQTNHTDNIISIKTKFYNKSPLVIMSPGTGAEFTAVVVVSDLIKLTNVIRDILAQGVMLPW